MDTLGRLDDGEETPWRGGDAVRSSASGRRSARAPASEGGGGEHREAFHYACEKTLRVRDIEDDVRRVCAVPLRARDRDLTVMTVRASALDGTPVRVAPVAVDDTLYLDFRDLRALQAHAIVPGLDEAVRELQRLSAGGRG